MPNAADLAKRFDKAVDVVISGHTHQAYNCKIDGKLVTSASSFGRMVTSIDLALDPRTHDVVTAEAHNVVVKRDGPSDAAMAALVERYRELTKERGAERVGAISRRGTGRCASAGCR